VGLAECILLGWLWRIDVLRRHANDRSDWRLGRWWDYLIRIVIPVILGTLFFWSLFSDITKPGGFLRDESGNLSVANCAGMVIMISALVMAIILSLIKDVGRTKDYLFNEDTSVKKGYGFGMLILLIALVSAVLTFVAFRNTVKGISLSNLNIFLPMSLSVCAVLMANYLMVKFSKSGVSPSCSARWAGLIATITVSASLALYLIRLTKSSDVETDSVVHSEALSPVSYMILTVVVLLVVIGLGWCFYKAIAAGSANAAEQHPDEVGDEPQSQQGDNTNSKENV
jgi:NSS family neurotransmitter:Na+ symporter